MVTNPRRLFLMLAASVILSSPMAVYADNGGGDKTSWHQDGGWHHGQEGLMMAKILGLSDDQVKQLNEIKRKQRESMKSSFEQMESLSASFNAEIAKAAVDMTKINGLQNQLKTLQGQQIDERLNSILAIKKLLTPEQFAGYMALQNEWKLKKHMMGHGKYVHKAPWGHEGDWHGGNKEDKGDAQ